MEEEINYGWFRQVLLSRKRVADEDGLLLMINAFNKN
jgi:hypothetical protein